MPARIVLALLLTALLGAPVAARAAEPGIADTQPGPTNTEAVHGPAGWLLDLYQHHRLAFAVVVTLTMAGLGAAIAVTAEVVLGAFGLGVRRMSHRE